MPVKKIAVITTVVAILVVVGFFAYSGMNAVDVEAFAVKKDTLQEYVEVRGRVELDKTEKVFSKLDVRIKKVMVKEGMDVDVNTKLAEGDIEDLNYAIEKAQAAYDSEKANLADLKNLVKPEQLKQAEAQIEVAKIGLSAAKLDYDYIKDKLDNIRILYENNGTSEQSVKDAELAVNVAESVLNNAEQSLKIATYNLEILKKGASQSSIEAQEANAEQFRIQLDDLKNKMNKIIVYSNIKGTVITKNIDEEATVQAGTLLFELGDYSSAYIRVDVLTDDAGKIKIGQKVLISGELLNDDEILGEVYYIGPKAETSVSSLGVEQQRIEMRIKFDNSTLKFRPGYGVDVKIITEEKNNTIFVPDKAVFDMGGEDSVYVIKGDKLQLRRVKTGIENKDYIEIVEGLSEGDKVVEDSVNDLKQGMKVK